MPTVTQLEYVLAVHESGHFGRAAAAVGVSQPTLSSQIQKAETELGITIFDRRARPVVATELGGAVIAQSRVVVEAHENLLRLAKGMFAEPAGPFVLGIIPTLAPYVLPWFLQRFADDYPAVQLTVVERPTDELLAEMHHRRIDAAVLATPLGETSIEERVLFYDPFYLYANEDEPVLAAAEVELDDLDPTKLWLLEDGHCFRAQVLNFCGVVERTHLGSVRFAAGSLETIKNLIDASEGYTLIPETYARTLSRGQRQRSVRAFDDHAPLREVSLVHHRSAYKRDVLAALEASIRACTPRALARVAPEGDILAIRHDQSG